MHQCDKQLLGSTGTDCSSRVSSNGQDLTCPPPGIDHLCNHRHAADIGTVFDKLEGSRGEAVDLWTEEEETDTKIGDS